jgi:Ferritin-like domain
MANHISIDVRDASRGVREALDEPATQTRSVFLERAVAVGGTLVAGGVAVAGLPALALGAPSPKQDAEILNFALLLEELEAAFFADAERRAQLTPALREYVRVVGAHERAHVAFLRKALGNKARKRPTFDFGRATRDRNAFTATGAEPHEGHARCGRDDRLRRGPPRGLDSSHRRHESGAEGDGAADLRR